MVGDRPVARIVKSRRQTGPATKPLHSSPLLSRLHPSPPLPLEVGPLNPARGSGERCKLPQQDLGRSPSRNRFWCILALKSGNNFNDFPENQLIKFRALFLPCFFLFTQFLITFICVSKSINDEERGGNCLLVPECIATVWVKTYHSRSLCHQSINQSINRFIQKW